MRDRNGKNLYSYSQLCERSDGSERHCCHWKVHHCYAKRSHRRQSSVSVPRLQLVAGQMKFGAVTTTTTNRCESSVSTWSRGKRADRKSVVNRRQCIRCCWCRSRCNGVNVRRAQTIRSASTQVYSIGKPHRSAIGNYRKWSRSWRRSAVMCSLRMYLKPETKKKPFDLI